MFMSDFKESSYNDMIESLKKIETLCGAISQEWKETVQNIRETIEGIDFPTIKRLYEKYLTSTINDIINNVGTGE